MVLCVHARACDAVHFITLWLAMTCRKAIKINPKLLLAIYQNYTLKRHKNNYIDTWPNRKRRLENVNDRSRAFEISNARNEWKSEREIENERKGSNHLFVIKRSGSLMRFPIFDLFLISVVLAMRCVSVFSST